MPTYLVVQVLSRKQDSQHVERLVEAQNKAAAIRFVANDTITAEPVEIADAMRLAQAGVKVERAA